MKLFAPLERARRRARLGVVVDEVVGLGSRVLHGVRGAEHDTSGDLAPFFDRAPEELFPPPAGVPMMKPVRALPSPLGPGVTLAFPSAYEPLCPTYRARHEREYAANKTAYLRWFRREGATRRALLLYVHGWLEPGPLLEEATLLRKFRGELDVDVAHVQLPFHGRRNPRGALFHGEFFWSADLVRSVEAVRQAISDVRHAVAYFRSQGYTEIGVTGISLGGSLTMLLACLEPLPDYVVPMIAHLDLASAVETAPILWRMKSDLDRFGVDAGRRAEIFSRIGIGSILPKLAPERQLWVAGRDDVYLSAGVVERQWDAWGRPPILWIDTGHMTFPLALGTIVDRMHAFRASLPAGGAPGPFGHQSRG